MITPANVRRYEELLAPGADPAPYEYDTLFAAKGWFDRRRAKRRFKLLKKLDVRLRTMLQPDEKVFFLAAGTTVTLAEQFFVGWVAYYLNRRALVFTTNRVLLVQIDSRGRPRELVSQLRYDRLASVRSTWNGICEVKAQGGTKFKFQGVPRAERKFLHKFLADIVRPQPPGPADKPGVIEHLCPKCFRMTPDHPPACPHCHTPFKTPKQAAMRSLLFPGLGDWYLGHRGFATFEIIGAAFMWLFLVVFPLMSGEIVDQETGEVYALSIEYWNTVVVIIAIMHGMDSLMTHHFARKGHHAQ